MSVLTTTLFMLWVVCSQVEGLTRVVKYTLTAGNSAWKNGNVTHKSTTAGLSASCAVQCLIRATCNAYIEADEEEPNCTLMQLDPALMFLPSGNKPQGTTDYFMSSNLQPQGQASPVILVLGQYDIDTDFVIDVEARSSFPTQLRKDAPSGVASQTTMHCYKDGGSILFHQIVGEYRTWVFTLSNQTWKELARMNPSHSECELIELDDDCTKYICPAGYSSQDSYTHKVALYDALADAWSYNAPLLQDKRIGIPQTRVFYIFGGNWCSQNQGCHEKKSVVVYDYDNQYSNEKLEYTNLNFQIQFCAPSRKSNHPGWNIICYIAVQQKLFIYDVEEDSFELKTLSGLLSADAKTARNAMASADWTKIYFVGINNNKGFIYTPITGEASELLLEPIEGADPASDVLGFNL